MPYIVAVVAYVAMAAFFEYMLIAPSPATTGVALLAAVVAGGFVWFVRRDLGEHHADDPSEVATRPNRPPRVVAGALLLGGTLAFAGLVGILYDELFRPLESDAPLQSYGSRATFDTTTTTDSPPATTETTEAILRGMEDLGALIDEWNTNQLVWIEAFHDPDVHLGEYLRTSQEVVEAQVKAVAHMSAETSLMPSEAQEVFFPVVTHFRGRIPLLEDLIAASLRTDAEFQEAVEAYQDFSQQDGIDSLEKMWMHPTVAAYLGEEERDAVLDAIEVMIGQS